MQSLLGHGEANGITPLLCALERDHAEWKTCDAGSEMRLFVQRSGARRMDMVCRGMASPGNGDCIVLEVCLPVPFLTSSVTASGPLRRPAAGSLFCFDFIALRVTVSICDGPSVNAELRPWEPGPLAGFAMCDPSRIREINETEITTMYQNKVTLIGFTGNDAEVRTNDNRSFTTLSLATKSSYKKDGILPLPLRSSPIRYRALKAFGDRWGCAAGMGA